MAGRAAPTSERASSSSWPCLQRKPIVGSENDPLEYEADALAERALAGGATATAARAAKGVIQRRCTSCAGARSDDAKELCDGCLQRQHAALGQLPEVSDALAGRIEGLRGTGRPLPEGERSFFESRLGHDFSRVRIHADGEAAETAPALQAHAYTLGNDVVFAPGAYRGGSAVSRKLLAHELVHVIQQGHAARIGGTAAVTPGPEHIQRQAFSTRPKRDRCPDHHPSVHPCAPYSSPEQRARVRAYAAVGFDTPAMNALGNLLVTAATTGEGAASAIDTTMKKRLPAGARAEMLKIASCDLSPEEAIAVRAAFTARKSRGGKQFGKLSTATRCEIYDLLDERAAPLEAPVGAERAAELRAEQEAASESYVRAEQERRAAARERAAEAQQFEDDQAAYAKAGRNDIVGALLPTYLAPYRRTYSQQIHNPYLRFNAGIAERTTTVPLMVAMTEPVVRPLAALLEFIECLFGAMRGKDVDALADRLKSSPLLLLGFPPHFQAGIIVGAGEEVARVAKDLYHLVTDPMHIVHELDNLLTLLWSPKAQELGCALGKDMGEELSAEIARLATLDDDSLAYELGKFIGPQVFYTLLAILAPEAVAALKGTRVFKRVVKVLEGMIDELEWLKKLRKRLALREPHAPHELPSGHGRRHALDEPHGGHESSADEAERMEELGKRVEKEGVSGTAATHHEPWRSNAERGIPNRSLEGAVDLAKKHVDWDPEEYVFELDSRLPDNVTASYFELKDVKADTVIDLDRIAPWNPVTEKNRFTVKINPRILTSDDAIISVIKHEIHESEALLEQFVQSRGRMRADRLKGLVDGETGRLHHDAWDAADALLKSIKDSE
jgi:hypothetical protein